MARQSNKDREGDSAFKDVSDLQEKAAEEAKQPTVDEEGNAVATEAPASAELQQELSHRAAASFEGGGPWPPEFLSRFTDPTRAERSVEDAYTSHEEQDKEQS